MADPTARIQSEDGVVVLHCPPELLREPLVQQERSLNWITENVSVICEERTRKWWWIAFLIFAPIALLVPLLLGYQVANAWACGREPAVRLGLGHHEFVFGSASPRRHADLAILFLTRQKCAQASPRVEADRVRGECASVSRLSRRRRVEGWWLFPIPNWNGSGKLRSPLWGRVCGFTYFPCPCCSGYVGLIPDLAMMRDRAKSKIRNGSRHRRARLARGNAMAAL